MQKQLEEQQIKSKEWLSWPDDAVLKRTGLIAFGITILVVALGAAYMAGYVNFSQNENRGGLEAAISEFERAIELEPDNAEAYEYLSQAYQLAGQPQKAMEIYQAVLATNPEAAWAYAGLGQVYLKQNQLEAATTAFKQAIDLDPASEGAYTSLAGLYNQQQKIEASLALYQLAIEANPTDGWPWRELGNTYVLAGDNEQALAAFKQAIVLDPDNAGLYNQLGNLYQWNRQQPAEALPYYRRAVALAPDQGWYYATLAGALFALDRKTEGMETLETALRREPNSSIVQQTAGDLMLQYNSPAAAQPYYEEAIKLDSQNVYAHLGLTRALRQQGEYEQSLHHAQQAAKVAQDQANRGTAYIEQALTYQASHQKVLALDYFLKAADLLPNNDWLQATLGDFYRLEKEQPEQAELYYRQAITISPNQPWHHLALGKTLLALNRETEGLSELEKALTLAHQDVAIYLELGYLASEQSDWERAAQIYNLALSQGVDNFDIYLHLGDVYKIMGQPTQAKQQYQQAARLSPDDPQLRQRLPDGP